MRSDLVKERFSDVLGRQNAGPYIASVILAVANDPKLQECQPESIYISAMRAATLRLSVDPSTGQAYLVPFGGKATLIVGYKGLHDMAVRTGKYRYINAGPIYEGVTVELDSISGFHSLIGNPTSKVIVGWLGAFQMLAGYSHTMYMTVEEIHDHAKKYSKSYGHKLSGWQTDPQAMERKTVLRLLLRRWGYLDPSDATVLESIEGDPDSIDVEPINDQQSDHAGRSEDEILHDLGYDSPEKASAHEPEVEPDAKINGRPYPSETVKAKITEMVAKNKDAKIHENHRKVVASVLDTTFNGEKTMRYELCQWLVGVSSTKKMTAAQVRALLTWLGVDRFEDIPSEYVIAEARSCHTAALEAGGQAKLFEQGKAGEKP